MAACSDETHGMAMHLWLQTTACCDTGLFKTGVGSVGEDLRAEGRTVDPGSFEQDFEVGKVLGVEGLAELAELFFRSEEFGGRAGRVGIGPGEDNNVAGMALMLAKLS